MKRSIPNCMNIEILCVGRLKEKYWRDAAAEYLKRLSSYGKITVTELQDEQTKENASPRETEAVLAREAERIRKAVKNDAYVITLEINGTRLSSEELADHLEGLAVKGTGRIQFVIGGSLGLHKSITDLSDLHLSFSDFTFPHQMMRVILLEQLYRSFRIIRNEPYHK